jgi:predicted dehydrogenase
MKWVSQLANTHNVEITAVCDIWNQARDAGAAQIEKLSGRSPRKCRTLTEICDLKDIDVLVIATADFQHPPHTRQAVEAGKDVYVEKPFGCDFQQIRLAREAVKATKRIVQVGTQRRSEGLPWAARDFVRSGRLGKVTFIEMTDSLFQQRWRIPGCETELTEKDTDWKEFLSYTPEVPFDPRRYREFRLFWPYSTGIFCQWMSHAVDMVNLVLDDIPKAVVAGGGVFVWKDGRTNPDTAQCIVEYPSGCLFSYHMRMGNAADSRTLTFYGTNGTLDLNAGLAYGEGGGGDVIVKPGTNHVPDFSIAADKRLPERARGGVLLKPEPDEDHMGNFFDCVRSRRQPKAPIDAAFAHALATSMAGLSLRLKTRIEYDMSTDTLMPLQKI